MLFSCLSREPASPAANTLERPSAHFKFAGGTPVRKPEECRFTKTHEWISTDGTVGISDHAQKEITDVVFVELPKVGKEFKAGEACAVVESVKAAFDIYAPVSGKVVKVNATVGKNPGIVNQSPYGDGWLFTLENTSEAGAKLMSHADYETFLNADTH
jgi:glycine cleavage system H protein